MENYYINKERHGDGSREVHREYCVFMPTANNAVFVGRFRTTDEALRKAKYLYKDTYGCEMCCKTG